MPARHITVSPDGQIHELCVVHEIELTRPEPTPYEAREVCRRARLAHAADVTAWMAWHTARMILLVVIVAFACALLGATAAANAFERGAIGLLAIFGAASAASLILTVRARPRRR